MPQIQLESEAHLWMHKPLYSEGMHSVSLAVDRTLCLAVCISTDFCRCLIWHLPEFHNSSSTKFTKCTMLKTVQLMLCVLKRDRVYKSGLP